MRRKLCAAVLALCMTGLPVMGEYPAIRTALTARAEGECYTLCEDGTLTLHGTVTEDAFGALDRESTTSITAEPGTVLPERCHSLFSGFSNVLTIDLRGADTSQTTSMNAMFNGCSSLTSLDVSDFDTSQVTAMQEMFSHCEALTALDLSGFDTSQVTDMGYMFEDCSALTRLDLSGFDTSQADNTTKMFRRCAALRTLVLGAQFAQIDADMQLPNRPGWARSADPQTRISGNTGYAELTNEGTTTYVRILTSIPGDANAAGVVDVTDAVALQKYLVRKGGLLNIVPCDISSDGAVNVLDLALLKQLLIK